MVHALNNAIKITAIAVTLAMGALIWAVGMAPVAHHFLMPAAMVTGGAG